MKKVLTIILVVVLAFCLICFSLFPDDEFDLENSFSALSTTLNPLFLGIDFVSDVFTTLFVEEKEVTIFKDSISSETGRLEFKGQLERYINYFYLDAQGIRDRVTDQGLFNFDVYQNDKIHEEHKVANLRCYVDNGAELWTNGLDPNKMIHVFYCGICEKVVAYHFYNNGAVLCYPYDYWDLLTERPANLVDVLPMYYTAVIEFSKSVYWVADGSVYHYDASCTYISDSTTIYSGLVSDAYEKGITKRCSRCCN